MKTLINPTQDAPQEETSTLLNIDEYLRKRLMPADEAIPHIHGIQMFGNSIPAETVGGDLFEYICFQQRYDIDARIEQAHQLAQVFVEPLPNGVAPRNLVDDQVQWMKATPDYRPEMEREYRFARSTEQRRIAEELRELYSTAGVLVVDAQGHGIISAKIASTVHDAFHALMLAELDRYGRAASMLLENINLRLAQSVSARNALEKEGTREIATMIYGEIHSNGQFRYTNFGHPPPLVFSTESCRFRSVNEKVAQFLPLGLQIPSGHPDRAKYFSLAVRPTEPTHSGIDEIVLMSQGDVLVLYTDGVYDGTDAEERKTLESIMRERCRQPAKEICNALLDYAVNRDARLRQSGNSDLIDDKTVFIVKRI